MFLAGLYVGLGSFGRAAATLVSSGNLPGTGGGGSGRGPNGRWFDIEEVVLYKESNDVRLLKSFTPDLDTGEPGMDEALDDRESGLGSSAAPFIRSRAKRSLRSGAA